MDSRADHTITRTGANTPANIPGAKSIELSAWPKSLKEMATALGTAAAKSL